MAGQQSGSRNLRDTVYASVQRFRRISASCTMYGAGLERGKIPSKHSFLMACRSSTSPTTSTWAADRFIDRWSGHSAHMWEASSMRACSLRSVCRYQARCRSNKARHQWKPSSRDLLRHPSRAWRFLRRVWGVRTSRSSWRGQSVTETRRASPNVLTMYCSLVACESCLRMPRRPGDVSKLLL